MFKISARTVLELGSELISSDIIAFYELIKNAFDAASKNGVEIRFQVVLRRNVYLRLHAHATTPAPEGETKTEAAVRERETLGRLKAEASSNIEPTAAPEAVAIFNSMIGSAHSLLAFVDKLDDAYRTLNTIEVSDTGSGMSMTDLTRCYLVIGTPSRKREVDEAILNGHAKAPFLGEKGIGRLSAIRLGDRLRLETARSTDSLMNVLDIDWRRFDTLDAMVEEIDIKPETGGAKSTPAWSGTRLTIGDLAEDWTEARVRTFAEYNFARLTDNFVDPKLRPRIALFWNRSRITIPFMDRLLLEQAHAAVRGVYSIENGEPILRCKLDAFALGFPHPHETDSVTLTLPEIDGIVLGTTQDIPATALTSVGRFEFEAFWYNRRLLGHVDSIGDQRAVRALQKKWAGVLLFRDGFRVFPYGDDDDDWLGLDRRAMGRPGYTLNKAQFVGRVNIARVGNPYLVDQTNREGLRANSEQEVFVAILQYVIQELLWEFLRNIEKQYKHQPLDLGEIKNEVTQLETRAKNALRRVRKLVPKADEPFVDDLQQAFLEFKDLADRAQRRIAEIEEDSRQMVQMAGVGLMVEVVAHELARASESALASLEGLRGKDVPTEVRAKLDTLRAEMKSVSKRLRVLDPLSVSGRQRSEVFDLGALIEDLREGHAAQFQRHNIALQIEHPKRAIRVRAVKGMVVQILENLIANSVYWMQLRVARETRYAPVISIRMMTDPVTIYFSDNGPGIAPENREKVFRPFWSLKEKAKRRGLGLFIARENATYLGGSLVLSERADPQTRRLHEFILELQGGAEI